jgi:hypothetical protein
VPPTLLLAIQVASSFLVLGLLAATVVAVRLRALPRERALRALLWAHTPRYVPLALLAPGQTDAGVSAPVISAIAWGDFASAALAVAAIIALRARGEAAIGWVWVFTVVSTFDIATALSVGIGSGLHERALGAGWYVLTLYVPLVCISQAMIARWLLPRRPLAAEVAP